MNNDLIEAIQEHNNDLAAAIINDDLRVDLYSNEGEWPSSPFEFALISNNVEAAALMLSRGDPNSINDGRRFGARSEAMAELLIRYGADVHIGNPSRLITPLEEAAASGFLTVVEVLLKYGADPMIGIPLDRAVRAGHPVHPYGHHTDEVVKLLSELGLDRKWPYLVPSDFPQLILKRSYDHLRTYDGWILHYLAHVGDINSIQLMLEHELSNEPDDWRHELGINGNCGRVMIDGGRSAIKNGKQQWDYWNWTGVWTPLHAAALQGRTDVIRVLLEYGADIHAGESEDVLSPLEVASEWGRIGAVRTLLKHGADADVGLPLDRAVRSLPYPMNSHEKVAHLLCASGATRKWRYLIPADFPDDDRFDERLKEFNPRGSLLEALAAVGDVASIRTMLDYETPSEPASWNEELSTEAFSNQIRWALSTAAANGDVGLIRLLIKHGAVVDAEGYEGHTPLERAIVNDHLDAVRILVEYGADVNHCRDGSTPMICAEEQEHESIVKYLDEQGAMHETYIEAREREFYSQVHGECDHDIDQDECHECDPFFDE